MARRNPAVQEVRDISTTTRDLAYEIGSRINHPDVFVSPAPWWDVKVEYQRDRASDIIVRFTTKDATQAEFVARAMSNALKDYAQSLRCKPNWAQL